MVSTAVDIIHAPTRLHIGSIPFLKIAEHCKRYSNKIALITSGHVPFIAELQDALKQANLHVLGVDPVSSHLSVDALERLVLSLKAARVKCILAAGDEYAFNYTKILSLLASNAIHAGDVFLEGKVPVSFEVPALSTIGVPTAVLTFGESNGSFMFRSRDSAYTRRYVHSASCFDECFLNPEWLVTESHDALKASVFAMIPIVIDVFVSAFRRAHSLFLLKKTLDIANLCLSQLMHKTEPIHIKTNLLYASSYLSEVIQQHSFGLVLPLSEAICSLYEDIAKEIPVVTVGMTLIEQQIRQNPQIYKTIFPFFSSLTKGNNHVQSSPSSVPYIQIINKLRRQLHLPTTLRSVGIKQEDFTFIVDNFWKNYQQEAIRRDISHEGVLSFLRAAY